MSASHPGMNSKSLSSCPSCVTGDGRFIGGQTKAIVGSIVAIKDANACKDNPDCLCGCHELWQKMRENHVPIGQKQ